jgi:hypothetical protein
MKKLPAFGGPLIAAAATVGVSLALAASPPTVTTGAAKEVAATSAIVTGKVNPNGQQTTYAFQYGQDTTYAGETAPQSGGSGTTATEVTATVSGLRPGTTYHVRLVAASGGVSAAGNDITFKTTGVAPPAGVLPTVATAPAMVTDVHDAVLSGTIGPSTTPVTYFFRLGPGLPYGVETIPQHLPASTSPRSVTAPVGGLASDHTYHYRLVVLGEGDEAAAGSDMTFTTGAIGRLAPRALQLRASPAVQHHLPAVVHVSGRLVPPSGVSGSRACEGFVTITFRRAHEVAIQVLHAGLRTSCTFSLPVRFSSAKRLHGGHLVVEAVFPGNQVLHRITSRTRVVV